MCTRLQRMIMLIQKYSITVEYKAGTQLFIPNTSRAPLSQEACELEFKQNDINVLQTLPISIPKLNTLKQETVEDKSLADLMTTVKTGWPADKTNVAEGAKPYWNYYDKFCVMNGILLKGTRVIIPVTMRPEMLRIIHSSHVRIDKCKYRCYLLAWNVCTNRRHGI